MSAPAQRMAYNEPTWLDTLAAWVLALLWVLPLLYVFWTAFHPAEWATRFELNAPLTLDNFRRAWAAAPFARYFLNTALLVTMVLAAQLVLSTLAAYAFARYRFPGRDVAFALVLVQLMIRLGACGAAMRRTSPFACSIGPVGQNRSAATSALSPPRWRRACATCGSMGRRACRTINRWT